MVDVFDLKLSSEDCVGLSLVMGINFKVKVFWDLIRDMKNFCFSNRCFFKKEV